MAETVPLRDYIDRRFADNETLYTERDARLRDVVNDLAHKLERERNEHDRRFADLEAGKASGDSLAVYQRWQRTIVYGLVGTGITVLVTLAIAVYSFTHGQAP